MKFTSYIPLLNRSYRKYMYTYHQFWLLKRLYMLLFIIFLILSFKIMKIHIVYVAFFIVYKHIILQAYEFASFWIYRLLSLKAYTFTWKLVLCSCLGYFWAVLGLFWGCFGAVLGLFWDCFGATFTRLLGETFYNHQVTLKQMPTNY